MEGNWLEVRGSGDVERLEETTQERKLQVYFCEYFVVGGGRGGERWKEAVTLE